MGGGRVCGLVRFIIRGRLEQFADTANGTDEGAGLQRHHDDLAIRAVTNAGQGFGIFLGHEVVDRLATALGNGLGDHLSGAGFCLGLSLPRFGGEEGGLTFPFGLEDLRLFFALGLEDP